MSVENGIRTQASSQGTFFDQRGNATGTGGYVLSGDFDLTRDDDGAVSALFSSRLTYEWRVSEQAMAGLFMGANLSRSPVDESSFAGDIEGYGAALGGYFAREPRKGFYIDGYPSLGSVCEYPHGQKHHR